MNPQPPYYERKIEAPNGRSILIHLVGGRQGGADCFDFLPSEPVMGVTRFSTTGGNAFFNPEDGYFYLYDSRLIIRINAGTWQPASVEGPETLHFLTLSISNGNLYMECFTADRNRKSESHSKPLAEIDWTDGLGSAADGVFPSNRMQSRPRCGAPMTLNDGTAQGHLR